MKKLRMLTIFFLIAGVCAIAQPQQSWQVLNIHDKEVALIYEVFYKPGTVQYLESYPSTSEAQPYSTKVSSVGADPYLDFWHTKAQRGDRVFGAQSTSSGFAQADIVNSGDAAVWVFRPNATSSPAAVILGLRSTSTPAGGTGTMSPGKVTLTLPAKSVARAAVIFRKSKNPMYIDSNQIFLEGSDEKADFITLATNDGTAPITISIMGWTTINIPVPGGKRYMSLTSKTAGNNVTFIAGRFPSEPECFAAAVIVTSTP